MIDYLPIGTKHISIILRQNYLIKSKSQLYSHYTRIGEAVQSTNRITLKFPLLLRRLTFVYRNKDF